MEPLQSSPAEAMPAYLVSKWVDISKRRRGTGGANGLTLQRRGLSPVGWAALEPEPAAVAMAFGIGGISLGADASRPAGIGSVASVKSSCRTGHTAMPSRIAATSAQLDRISAASARFSPHSLSSHIGRPRFFHNRGP